MMPTKKSTTKAASAAAETAETKKTAAVKTEEVKTAEPAKTAKKPVKRTTAKRTVSKKAAAKAEVKEDVYIQFLGKEINLKDIEASAKKAWTEETGSKESDIKEMQIYVKPEESAAYYVVNGEVAEGGRKIEF